MNSHGKAMLNTFIIVAVPPLEYLVSSKHFFFQILFLFLFFLTRPRLKNIDRSSAQHLEVTVGDLTVIITDFKEKAKPTSTSASAASADLHSQSGSSSDNTERGVSRCSSPREESSSVNGETH